jgi:hypothetical protein
MLELIAVEILEIAADAAFSYIISSLFKKEKQSLKDHLKDSLKSEATDLVLDAALEVAIDLL